MTRINLGFAAWLLLCLTGASRAGEGGSISGQVTWEGEAPKPVMLDITSKPEDLKVCACVPGEAAKASPRLAVDSATKGVAFTVVTLEGVPEEKAKPFPEREVVMDQKCCEFHPHVVWVEAGKTLLLKNSDNTLHNVHAKSSEGAAFNVSMPEKDQVLKRKLKDAGVLSLVCDAGHPWMSAYIFVVENPYIAITDAQGRFMIDGIPPGKYTLHYWHEGWEVTPILDLKTQKPSAYRYSDPLTRSVPVEVKGGAPTVAGAMLSVAGFKK